MEIFPGTLSHNKNKLMNTFIPNEVRTDLCIPTSLLFQCEGLMQILVPQEENDLFDIDCATYRFK